MPCNRAMHPHHHHHEQQQPPPPVSSGDIDQPIVEKQSTATVTSTTVTNYQLQKTHKVKLSKNNNNNNKTVYTRKRIRSSIKRENSSSSSISSTAATTATTTTATTTTTPAKNNNNNDGVNYSKCDNNNKINITMNANATVSYQKPIDGPTISDEEEEDEEEEATTSNNNNHHDHHHQITHPSSPSIISNLKQQHQAKSKRSRYILSSASRKKLTCLAMNIIGNSSNANNTNQQQQQQQQVSRDKSSTVTSILDTTKDYSKDNSSIVVLKSSSSPVKTTTMMNVVNSYRQDDSLDDIEVLPSHQLISNDFNNNNNNTELGDNKQQNQGKNQQNNNNNEKNTTDLRHLTNSNNIVANNSSTTKSQTNKQMCITQSRDPNNNATIQDKTIKREHWGKNIEFLLAVIGFAVDLGNIWRFPYICYRNGGGAFLIPYMIMFALGGLPIFYLEMSLGQYYASGCLTVWKHICPLVKGIGYAMCIINFFTGLYYNTIISHAVYFMFESFASELPWTGCNNTWNTYKCRTIDQRDQNETLRINIDPLIQYNSTDIQLMMSNNSDNSAAGQSIPLLTNLTSPAKEYYEREVLKIHLSGGIDDLGSFRWPLALYLAIVFIFVYFAIWKGVKSTGKAVWITALLPYFVLIPLLIRGIFLEGASVGIKYYLYPEWSKLKEITVWIDAAKQIFFSLGPGFGTLLALSSYNKFNHNCFRDAIIAASVNCFTSFIAGFVVFSVLGYMATIQHQDISNVATDGPGLVFQVYPEALATMTGSCFWSALFFAMVITLGIDSTFGGLEAVITGLCDEYPKVLRAHREIFIGCLIMVIYLCSLPTTTYGGNYVITVLDAYGTSLSLLFIVFMETASVCWIFGVTRFSDKLEEMYGYRPGLYWRICWTYITPTLMLFIFISAIIQEGERFTKLEYDGYRYPSWAVTLGWLMTASSIVCIPAYAIYLLATTPGTFSQRMKKCITPIEKSHCLEYDE